MKIGSLYRVAIGPPDQLARDDEYSTEYVYAFPTKDTVQGRYLEVGVVFMIIDIDQISPSGYKISYDVALIGEEVLFLSKGWQRAAVKVETKNS